MMGYKSKYLYYKSNKLSIITIPRSIIDVFGLFWINKDKIYITYREIKREEGLFLFKADELYEEKLYSYLDRNKRPVTPYGYQSIYRYYKDKKQSLITIPRSIIEAGNFHWKHKEDINILYNEFEGQKGLFLFKEN